MSFTLTVVSETHVSNDRAGFSIIAVGSNPQQALELAFWTDEVWAYSFTGGAFIKGDSLGFVTDAAQHIYTLSVRNNAYTLLIDGIATSLAGPLVDYTPANVFPDPYEVANTIFFGDDTSSARAVVDLTRITLAPVPLPGSLLLMLPALTFVAVRLRRNC